MKLREFRKSKWCREADGPEAARRISRQFPAWKERVENSGLVAKAGQLWDYFSSVRATGVDKVLVLGALIYLISPLDALPDAIPVLGWLDDLGVATVVLQFITTKLADLEEGEIPGTDRDLPMAAHSERQPANSNGLKSGTDPLPYRIAELYEAATDLGALEIADAVADLEAERDETLHQVLFVGRYNVGKSTLLNALIGQRCLPVGPVPTTRALTYVVAGDTSELVSQDADGAITRHHSVSELLDKNHPALKAARRVLLTIPGQFISQDICVVDSPGLEDPDLEYSSLTLKAAPRADAIVMVLDATILLSDAELTFLKQLLLGDRDRKLFLVINKADRLSPAELTSTRLAAEQHLRELGVTPRFFSLSAETAGKAVLDGRAEDAPPEFLEFRDALTTFLSGDIRRTRARHLRGRVATLADNLRTLCHANIALAAQNEQKRAETLAKAEAYRKKTLDAVLSQRTRNEELIGRIERRCQANIRVFFADLEGALSRHVEGLGLKELQQTETIAHAVRDQTKSFVEGQLRDIHKELSESTSAAIYDLQTALHGRPFTLDGVHVKPALRPEQIAPALLVLSFPFVGMFTFIYLSAGALFGRSVIENLCRSLLETVGASRLRAEVREQLKPRLHEYADGVEKSLTEHFNALRKTTSNQLESAAAEMLGAGAIRPTPPTDAPREDSSRRWQQRLVPLCSTNSPP